MAGLASGAEGNPPSASPVGADPQTVALWLFDDPEYFNATLTDASENWYDLRLQPGGKLVPGRFGSALAMSEDRVWTAKGVGQSAYKNVPGSVQPFKTVTYARVPYHGDWGGSPITPPAKLLAALEKSDWTWEFWLKLNQAPATEASLVDMHAQAFYCALSAQAERLLVRNRMGRIERVFPLQAGELADGRWHHLAVTCSDPDKRLDFFLDGVRRNPRNDQGPSGAYPEPGKEFAIDLLSPPLKDKPCEALLDEMRVSDVVHYRKNFTVPGTFSRNFGPNPPAPAQPNGPPLLFGSQSTAGPAQLGSRKHLFIDDALIGTMERVRLTANPPPVESYEYVDYQPRPWEVTAGAGASGFDGFRCVYDHKGKVRFMVTNGGMWTKGSNTTWNLLTSTDGLHLERPALNLFPSESGAGPNTVLLGPTQETFFADDNPATPAEEKFKYSAFFFNRGIYLFTSPDGIHWRRNEVAALPLDCGGGAEMSWDDQTGTYKTYLRVHNLPVYRLKPLEKEAPGNRYAALAETRLPLSPWPFQRLDNPSITGDLVLPLVSGPPGELPIPFAPNESGEVYRTRAIKYPWAADVYLAFVWRLGSSDAMQTELAVSRDGVNWKYCGVNPAYYPSGWKLGEKTVVEALSVQGMIRREDQLWSYARIKFGGHHATSVNDRIARVTQRLDGFVSLDAGAQTGWLQTKPFVFDGKRLELNVAAQGEARVGILDEAGKPIPGFAVGDCDPIRGDSVQRVVTWNGKSKAGRLAGKVIRLQVELRETKLYAFQFQ